MTKNELEALPDKTQHLVELIRNSDYYVKQSTSTPTYPFTLRSIEDELDHPGVDDAIKRGLVRGFPVLRERRIRR